MARCVAGNIYSTSFYLSCFHFLYLFKFCIVIMLLVEDSHWILSSSNFRDLACQQYSGGFTCIICEEILHGVVSQYGIDVLLWSMDYNIDENRPVFVKTDKTAPNRFCWFTKNRSTRFIFFENLGKFEKTKTGKIE
jgi:hypothetical protein